MVALKARKERNIRAWDTGGAQEAMLETQRRRGLQYLNLRIGVRSLEKSENSSTSQTWLRDLCSNLALNILLYG